MLSLFIIIFTLFPISSVSQNIQEFNDCTTKLYNCGETIRWIGYPFWGQDRPSYCGLPEFRLTCRDDGVTTVRIINTSFRVLSINQNASRITIALDDLWKESDACSLRSQPSIDNNSFEQTVFAYIPDRFMFLGLHLSCIENDDSAIPIRNRLNCSGDEGGRVSFYQNGSFYLGRGLCLSEIIVPVLKVAFDEFMQSETTSLAEVLKQGFPIEYRVDGGGICSRCEGSGGTCWTNTTSSVVPSCLCPTGVPRLVACPGSSGLFVPSLPRSPFIISTILSINPSNNWLKSTKTMISNLIRSCIETYFSSKDNIHSSVRNSGS
ncbi:hypothetical protein L6452_15387 [Arctium lappa]|uniref:Uncharacterized protein n=1 Tax=Arctium lappa TaxID=4217 RepID=A0ACB9CNQ3_ARCLA|nr:hypothetical protein L6452_15387 [Arctium lappa]